MKWDHMRVFLAVARLNRLSTAGKTLGLDTSTVGRQIDQLETDIKLKLFDRSPQGYALTTEGERLVPFAEQMERTALHIEDEVVGNEGDQLRGAVRIGAPEGFSRYILADIAIPFCEIYPQVQLQLVALPKNYSLSKREADIAISVTPPETGRLTIQKVANYQLKLYTTEKAAERFGEINSVSDLKRVRGIGYIPDLIFDEALNYIPRISREITPHLTSASIFVQLRWALQGAGVIILPSYIAKHHPEFIPILEEEVFFERSFYVLQHQDMANVKRIRQTAEFFVENIREAMKVI